MSKAKVMLAEIKPFVYHDRVTGNTIEVSVSEEYSAVLRINNRYYYFTKETGEMDGASIEYDGRGTIYDIQVLDRVLADQEVSDRSKSAVGTWRDYVMENRINA